MPVFLFFNCMQGIDNSIMETRREDNTAGHDHKLRKDQRVAAMVSALAAPVCQEEGLELVHTEYRRESAGRVLRL